MIALIIDTTEYSGNFEREICFFTTYQVDEFESNGHFDYDPAGEIVHQAWWDQHIVQDICEHDDNYFRSPVEIAITPGMFNNGSGKHYKDTPENEVIALKEHNDAMINWVGSVPLDKLVKYPAYQSVAIFVDEVPPEEVMNEFVARCDLFCANYMEMIPTFLRPNARAPKITGIRVEHNYVHK